MNDSGNIPPVIYHYCDSGAFRGILEGKELWLSDVHFTNDATEQSHFVEIVKKELHGRLRGPDEPFVRLLIDNFEWMALTAYACCFCEDGDLLSQWCRYADDGRGFALGFSSSWLQSQRHEYLPRHPLLLTGVEYNQDRQLKLLNDCIEEYLNRVRGLERTDRDGRREVSMHAIAKLWVLSTACKNHGFHEEREARLILTEVTDPGSQTEAIRKSVGVSAISHRTRGAQKCAFLSSCIRRRGARGDMFWSSEPGKR